MTTALGKSGIDPFSSNFYKLCTRSSGERFYVREGTLHQLDMSNFSTKIWYLFHRSQVQKEVKEVVGLTLKKLGETHQIENLTFKDLSGQDLFIDGEKFYLNRFRSIFKNLGHAVFDRKILYNKGEVDTQKTGKGVSQVGQFFEEDPGSLDALRQKKKAAKKALDGKTPTDADYKELRKEYEAIRYEYRVASVRFAQKTGVEFKQLGGGSSGSYLGVNVLGKAKLVFKPADEESTSDTPRSSWQKFLNSLRPKSGLFHDCMPLGKGYLAEAFASKVDLELGFFIVPKTKIETFSSSIFQKTAKSSKEGSCQLFVKGSTSAKEVLNIRYLNATRLIATPLLDQSEMAKIDLLEFQKMCIMDCLIRNIDRHPDNWMLKKDEQGTYHVVLIDNGLSMPEKIPQTYLARKYQHHWMGLPLADKAFNSSLIQQVRQLEEDALMQLFSSNKELSQAQKAMFQSSIQLMKTYFSDPNPTPKGLAEMYLAQARSTHHAMI